MFVLRCCVQIGGFRYLRWTIPDDTTAYFKQSGTMYTKTRDDGTPIQLFDSDVTLRINIRMIAHDSDAHAAGTHDCRTSGGCSYDYSFFDINMNGVHDSDESTEFYSPDMVLSTTHSPTTPSPTTFPTRNPTANPTVNPTASPTGNPTGNPTAFPTANPIANPTVNPTAQPTGSPVVWEWPGSDGVVIAPGDEQTVVFHGLHHQRRFAYQVRQCNSNKTGSRHFSRGSQPRATPHTPVCRALLSACAYRMLIGACNPML